MERTIVTSDVKFMDQSNRVTRVKVRQHFVDRMSGRGERERVEVVLCWLGREGTVRGEVICNYNDNDNSSSISTDRK